MKFQDLRQAEVFFIKEFDFPFMRLEQNSRAANAVNLFTGQLSYFFDSKDVEYRHRSIFEWRDVGDFRKKDNKA